MSKPKSRYLKPGHPSHACHQAWFLYAMQNPRGPGFGRLLLVEAKNHSAVAFLERVSDDGRVSEKCLLMSVFRDCPSVGIRAEEVSEVPFDAFAADIVDRARIERDRLAAEAYAEAFSARPEPTAASGNDLTRQRAVAALLELGFKKPQAESFLEGVRTDGIPLADIVKEALRKSAVA